MEAKKIGELNGWQTALFRVNLIFLPIIMSSLVALSVWLVTATFETQRELAVLREQVQGFISVGPRFTPSHAALLKAETKEEILHLVNDQYPPKWLVATVEALARRVEALEKK